MDPETLEAVLNQIDVVELSTLASYSSSVSDGCFSRLSDILPAPVIALPAFSHTLCWKCKTEPLC